MMMMKRLENLFDMRIKKKGMLAIVVTIVILSLIGLCVSCSPGTTAAPTSAANDPNLLGMWVEEAPEEIYGLPRDSIELFVDGKTIIANQYQGTYMIVDGKLQVTVDGETYAGKYEISGSKLTIFKDSGESKAYIKSIPAAANDPELLGMWVEEWHNIIVGLPRISIELFADGKTIIAGEYQGTFKIVDGKLQVTVEGETYTGEYEISESRLTIFKDNGESKVYIKSESTAVYDPLLFGKWVEEVPGEIYGLPRDSIELFADGKTIIADQYQGTYKIVDGKLQVTVEGETYIGKYEISGSKLTIFKDSGESKAYLKND